MKKEVIQLRIHKLLEIDKISLSPYEVKGRFNVEGLPMAVVDAIVQKALRLKIQEKHKTMDEESARKMRETFSSASGLSASSLFVNTFADEEDIKKRAAHAQTIKMIRGMLKASAPIEIIKATLLGLNLDETVVLQLLQEARAEIRQETEESENAA